MATSHVLPDPTHNFLRVVRRPLKTIFAPKTVAVIGASERPNSVGRAVLANLQSSSFGGAIFPVNLTRTNILGLTAYRTIADVPAAVDLAVIATPAATVPGLIRECVAAGVKGAIVLAAGFREQGPEGVELERQVLAAAQQGDLRLIGPNCLGIMRPPTGLNASFSGLMADPGSVAFVSQSGALCNAILDWSKVENVGFSAFVSIGTMLDVGWGDLIDFLGDDPHTQSIILYMESLGAARAFMSAAREVTLTKPIIVLKAGRTESGARAAVSHTGALVGNDAVIDAAFHRCGVLQVDTIAELFYLADVLAKQPRPQGPRLTILTNAGGPGVLASDSLVRSGGQLAELAPETVDALNVTLPPEWSHGNPVDVLSDADPQRYAAALKILQADRNSDGVLVIRTPQANAEPTKVADAVAEYAKGSGKPLLASWMGGPVTANGEASLNRAGIPTFPYPDTATRIFTAMWRYTENLRSLYETPAFSETCEALDLAAVTQLIDDARSTGRTLLSEAESKQLLAAYGIAVVETRSATSLEQALEHAAAIGYPVVLKLASKTITHKSDVGGVHLNLFDPEAVRRAYHTILAGVRPEDWLGVTVQPMVRDGYELIVGSHVDPQFGPVLLFGAGGQLVEIHNDQSLGLPPLTTTLARRMIVRTRIQRALQGIRGRPAVDMTALEELLVRFSQLVIEQRWIREIEINPLFAAYKADGSPGLLALDARVVLFGANVSAAQLPKPAIRPYPTQYVTPWTLKDGSPATIRPIRPEDEPLIVRFHQTLSQRSVYMRYFSAVALDALITHERLIRLCFIDYDREMALVVDREDPVTGEHSIVAVGRIIKLHGKDEAEYAGLVSDLFQGHGLGTEILRQLLRVARDEGIRRVVAETLPENRAMQRVFEKLGFQLRRGVNEDVFLAEIEL